MAESKSYPVQATKSPDYASGADPGRARDLRGYPLTELDIL